MILQQLPGRTVVYMENIDAGRIVVGEQLGMCDATGQAEQHASITKTRYTTDCGVTVDAWRLTGETVDIYVLPDRAPVRANDGLGLANALNSFNSPRYDFAPYVMAGKFSAAPERTILYDKARRAMSFADNLTKDLPGIYAFMSNIGADNGALFHPVIARYMWGIWHLGKRPARLKPVGYVDLRDYLKVLRDDRANMFSRPTHSSASLSLTPGKHPFVRVKGVDPSTNQALVEIGDMTVIDREKDRTFRPYVIIANRPFELRPGLQFRWSRVDFKGHAVFIMPVMALSDAFSPLTNLIDLLSPKQVIF